MADSGARSPDGRLWGRKYHYALNRHSPGELGKVLQGVKLSWGSGLNFRFCNSDFSR